MPLTLAVSITFTLLLLHSNFFLRPGKENEGNILTFSALKNQPSSPNHFIQLSIAFMSQEVELRLKSGTFLNSLMRQGPSSLLYFTFLSKNVDLFSLTESRKAGIKKNLRESVIYV
jgi:hypothetical protein